MVVAHMVFVLSRDALITCVVNTFTSLLAGCVTFSILGHIALEQDTSVGDVVKSGPGLVFLTYPEVVLKLPGAPFWAATFFVMLVVRAKSITGLCMFPFSEFPTPRSVSAARHRQRVLPGRVFHNRSRG